MNDRTNERRQQEEERTQKNKIGEKKKTKRKYKTLDWDARHPVDHGRTYVAELSKIIINEGMAAVGSTATSTHCVVEIMMIVCRSARSYVHVVKRHRHFCKHFGSFSIFFLLCSFVPSHSSLSLGSRFSSITRLFSSTPRLSTSRRKMKEKQIFARDFVFIRRQCVAEACDGYISSRYITSCAWIPH